MIYVIIGAVAAFVLLLLFWDDHDSAYDRGDGRSRYSRKAKEKPSQGSGQGWSQAQNQQSSWQSQNQARQPQQEAPRAEFKSEPNADALISMLKEVKEPIEEEMDLSFLDALVYYGHLEENTDSFGVTGLRYYCSIYDRGPIVGYVKPEPTNPHDSRAQAVYRNDGKLLGYIPRTQQDWYEEFNKQNVVCPYVGEITMNNRGLMLGEIKAILPVNKEFVQEEIVKGL